MGSVTARAVENRLGQALVVRVNPSRIEGYIPNRYPTGAVLEEALRFLPLSGPVRAKLRRRIKDAQSFAITGSQFGEVFDLMKDSEAGKRMTDLMENRSDYKNSDWYRELVDALHSGHVARHKATTMNSIQEIQDFFTGELLQLLDSMESNGYDDDIPNDLGTAFIGPEGVLLKSTGARHRFAAAKLLSVSDFPLMVRGADKDFLRREIGSLSLSNLENRLPGLVRKIEKLYQD
jgi:hypothetical protein